LGNDEGLGNDGGLGNDLIFVDGEVGNDSNLLARHLAIFRPWSLSFKGSRLTWRRTKGGWLRTRRCKAAIIIVASS